jgi:hypothetical protein
LKDLQYYRRFRATNLEGEALNLNKEPDLNDKQLLASIDFKKEIVSYHLYIINIRLLRQNIDSFMVFGDFHHSTIKVLPYSLWPSFYQYWTHADLKSNKYHKDYFYEVDLYYDPTSVEENVVSGARLPHEKSGRLVVYKKSKIKVPRKIYATGADFRSHMEQFEAQVEMLRKELDVT